MSNSAILTITGSDSTGGSGVQADITTISALGSKAVSVITSVTLQNTLGIQHFYDLPAPIVSGQLDAIVDDAPVRVTGHDGKMAVRLVYMGLDSLLSGSIVHDEHHGA